MKIFFAYFPRMEK